MVTAGVTARTITLKLKRRKDGAPEPPKFLGHGSCDSMSRCRLQCMHSELVRPELLCSATAQAVRCHAPQRCAQASSSSQGVRDGDLCVYADHSCRHTLAFSPA